MIIRDEAESLSRALESASAFADELIVVDTGSVDESISIAKSFGAKVSEIAWPGHFSEARNQSLDRAQGEWILVLDGDEYLSTELVAETRAVLQEAGEAVAYQLQICHFHDETRREDEVTRQWQVRLFRNLPRYRYRGLVHNQLMDLERDEVLEGEQLPVKVFHAGYLPSVWRKQNKAARISLLERAVEENPSDPFVHFNLANHLKVLGDYKRARVHYKNVRDRLDLPYLEWHFESYYAAAFCASQVDLHEEALQLCTEIYPHASTLLDITLRACEALFSLGRYQEAYQEATRALSKADAVQRKGWVRDRLRYRAGIAAFKLGAHREARVLFSELWSEGFQDDTLCVHWALSAFALGLQDEALMAWLEGQQSAPDNPDWEVVRRAFSQDQLISRALDFSGF